MLGLVTGCLNPDLELTLLPDNLLGFVHINTGQFNADIPDNIVEARERVDFGILGTERIYLCLEDGLDMTCSTLCDTLLVTGEFPPGITELRFQFLLGEIFPDLDMIGINQLNICIKIRRQVCDEITDRAIRCESDNFRTEFQLDPCTLLEVKPVLEIGCKIPFSSKCG
jgi:hypothetical protein